MEEKKFLNASEFLIDINNSSRRVTGKIGQSLLRALSDNDINLPSACGGNGACGYCKAQVMDNSGILTESEETMLTGEERKAGVRLSCQLFPENSIKIILPERLLGIKKYSTTIISIKKLTHDIKEFRLKLEKPDSIKFKAGQYVQVTVKPFPDKEEIVTRAYSIASVPSEKGYVDIIVRRVTGGICTNFMHDNLSEGDNLEISGPYGDFFLNEKDTEIKNLVFIAGGSGLGPVKSIILDVLQKKLPYNMTLFFGAVSGKDLYYADFFCDIQAANANFRYINALSVPSGNDCWKGETGLITEVVDRNIVSAENSAAYLCGSPGMIDACLLMLAKKGFVQKRILYDKF